MKLLFVIPARFERATHSLEGCCSIQLSYGTILKLWGKSNGFCLHYQMNSHHVPLFFICYYSMAFR